MRTGILLLCCILMSGCSFIRQSEIAMVVKDGQYGIAKGTGDAIYKATTAFNFFSKPLPVIQCISTTQE